MNATVTINLAGGAATTNVVAVLVENATIALQHQSGLSAAIGSGFTNLALTTGGASIATGIGAKLSGTLALTIGWSGSQVPAVTLQNLEPGSSPATVTWPTARGVQTQILMPGDPLALSGIVAS